MLTRVRRPTGTGLTAQERERLTLFAWRWAAQHDWEALPHDRASAQRLVFARWLVRQGYLGEGE